jgi:hypothetical protein
MLPEYDQLYGFLSSSTHADSQFSHIHYDNGRQTTGPTFNRRFAKVVMGNAAIWAYETVKTILENSTHPGASDELEFFMDLHVTALEFLQK